MKNKLLISVTKTTIYSYLTDQEDAGLAFDEWYNNSAVKKLKKVQSWTEQKEIYDFKIWTLKKRKPTKEKK